MTKPFFIVGCARSGTTSLCQILGSADNAVCLSEPAPNLNVECRDVIDDRYSGDIKDLLEATIGLRLKEHGANGLIYGEKNVTLAPFVPALHELFDCRFVFVHRDGRDVVTSLINWHNQLFGTVYRECQDRGALTERAYRSAASLPLEDDTSDYSRPRPSSSDPFFLRWETFSRLEMCAWYWSRINDLYTDNLRLLPEDSWIALDYTHPTLESVVRTVEFLGLKGISRDQVKIVLEQRVNSLQDRIQERAKFPRASDWSDGDRARFDCIAEITMRRLGYYPVEGFRRYKPSNYGNWWRDNAGGLDWYTWMYNGRKRAHEDLLDFVARCDSQGQKIDSILDVGCGLAVGYSEYFADRFYTGLDLSEKEITWCRTNRLNPRHRFLSADIIERPLTEKFDLVFSQGTIDNSYDMNAYLAAMVECSRGWIYVTAYRGWFPHLMRHRYMWDDETTCFYNDVSSAEIREVLEALGCTEIDIGPLPMPDGEIPQETRIIAKVKRTK